FIGNYTGDTLLLVWGAIFAGGILFNHKQVKYVEFIIKFDIVLDAVLVEGLQNHMSGAVCCIAGPAYRRFTVVAGVTTETALVNATFRCTVERQPHFF